MAVINAIDLQRIDLNLLVVFQALMQEGSVTRAGFKLGLSQSAVSAALGRLRTQFDDKLFERTRGGMVPTPKALSLSVQLSPSLSTIASVLLDDVEFEPWHSGRTFHLAMSDDIEMLFGPWVARLKLDHAWSVNFAIHQTNSHLWRESLNDPIVDLVLTTAPAHTAADFRTHPMFSGDYRVIYNPRLLSLSDPITVNEYVQTRHVRVSYDLQRGWVDEVMAAMGHKRDTLCTISHFSGLGALLRSVPVIATIPEHVAHRVAEFHDMKLSPVPIQMPRFTISALWRTELDGLVENQWIRDLCAKFVQAHEL